MQIEQTELPGVHIIELRVFADPRGFFKETYHKQRFVDAGISCEFVQDNYSRSTAGILRGLHFQTRRPQAKLVQCLRGEIFDVAVDLRRSSATFGRWVGVVLSETNHRQLFVPRGCAHGFYVLSETAEVSYKCDDYYDPGHERTLLWNDPVVGIEWPLRGEPILSDKDRAGVRLADAGAF